MPGRYANQLRRLRRLPPGAVAGENPNRRARDGKVYDEFCHPNLDELVASGPLDGPMPDHGHLLWHARAKPICACRAARAWRIILAAAPFFRFASRR